MLNSRQRAQLRGLANTLDPIVHIGKNGIGDTVKMQVEEALTARELIKARTLEMSPVNTREAADSIASAVGADVVQVIGSCFILYRESPDKEKRTIRLVK